MRLPFLALAGALALACVGPADAQTYRVVGTCGAQSLRVGDGSAAFLDATGNLCMAGGSGGGSGGTVTQGPAATDTSTNRWPVLAYQGGAWSFGLTGTLPAFAATPTFNLGTLNGAATATNQSTVITSLGAPSDTAYAGSGSSSIVAALKGVYNALLAPTPTGGNVIGFTTLRSAGANRSASVTTTAANLMAANTSRQGWKVKNDCSVAVWINFDAAATAAAGSGNIQVPAGAYMASEPGFVETGAMSAIAASGTCALTAREH